MDLEERSHPVGSHGSSDSERMVRKQKIDAKEMGQLCERPSNQTVAVIQDHKGRIGVFTSASPRCLDGGNVDLLHRHHRLEGALGLTATRRERIG
jgi:hypothetical protein